MNENLVIGTDLDGVLAQSQISSINELNRKYRCDFEYASWDSFDAIVREATKFGEDINSAYEWLFSERVMEQAPIIPGSNEAVTLLSLMGHNINVITSRPYTQFESTQRWVENNFPLIDSIYLRPSEAQLTSAEFKIRMMSELGIQVFIDDDPEVIIAVCEAIKNDYLPSLKYLFLIDHPWNRWYTTPFFVPRVGNWELGCYGWDEIVQILNG